MGMLVHATCHAECSDTNTFLDSVNSAWVSSNYTLLEQVLTNRVAECTNDILAKGLLYEYYDDICVDFYKARDAASEFIWLLQSPESGLGDFAPLLPSTQIADRRNTMKSNLTILLFLVFIFASVFDIRAIAECEGEDTLVVSRKFRTYDWGSSV